MNADLPNLVWLRAFEAAARLHSFTAAADELGLTQAAVSHQVRSLEKSFGATLFLRKARHLELTALGQAYYPAVAQALTDIAYSTRGLLGPLQARTVTLRAPISTAVLCIAPRVAQFHAQHPHIRLRLISAMWADSTEDTDIDVDLRLAASSWLDRRAHLLSQEHAVPVAQPQLAADITSVADLGGRNLVHIHGYQDNWLRYGDMAGFAIDASAPGLFVDTSLAAIELVATGAGLGMVMARYAEPALNSGRIARILNDEIPMGQGHYLMPSNTTAPASPEVARVRDWVVSLFETPPRGAATDGLPGAEQPATVRP